VSPRSEEYLDSAVARLATAQAALSLDPASTVSLAYYAAIYAARGALSERDRYAKTHKGTWHLFSEEFVTAGPFDRKLAGAAASLQRQREAADYDAARLSESDAAAALDIAERFVGAVQAMLTDG
jgi:uncharacterized protein (UPF0332 family)